MSPPELRRPPLAGGADADHHHRPESYTDHQTHMYGLAWRIRWLEGHRHWWLRTEAGRSQREFLDRRAA